MKDTIKMLETTFKSGVKNYLKRALPFYALIVSTFTELRDGDENDESEKVSTIKATLIQWAVEAGMDEAHAKYNINAALRKAGIRQRAPRSDKGEVDEGAKELAAYAQSKYGEKAVALLSSASRFLKSQKAAK